VTTHATTHDLTFDGPRVVKRFTSWARGEPLREWRGLSLLARYAPGLAPEPLSAQLDQEPPTIVMSRLPGEPLGPGRLTQAQMNALADALIRMHDSVPEDELEGADPTFDPRRAQAALLRLAAMTSLPEPDADSEVRRAHELATAFVHSPWLEEVRSLGAAKRAVFGQVDGNLANFLWDGEIVRILDLEDSGSSDPMFALAALVEHITVVHQAGMDAERFLERFSLTPAQRARLRVFRRVFAVFWLIRLLPGGPSYRRNPPGTVEAQAVRLLTLV
jgi:hypothetical protein